MVPVDLEPCCCLTIEFFPQRELTCSSNILENHCPILIEFWAPRLCKSARVTYNFERAPDLNRPLGTIGIKWKWVLRVYILNYVYTIPITGAGQIFLSTISNVSSHSYHLLATPHHPALETAYWDQCARDRHTTPKTPSHHPH